MSAGEVRTLFSRRRAPEDPAAPLITIAVSLYNYAEVIDACLDSAAAQTFPRLELLVVDDCSTDDSAARASAWLEAYADRFEHAALLQPAHNLGLSSARNLAFERAAAPFVLVLDADNTLLPRAAARLHEAITRAAADVAYAQIVFFGDGQGLGAADSWRPDFFKTDNYIDAMSLVRVDAWRAVGGYSQLEYGWEDYDFWCKFVEQGRQGVFVPELLFRYRVHHASMLRTDTAASRRRLVEMMRARHPWLELTP